MEQRNEKGQFVPGVSGNPGGRPKRDWTWAGLLEEAANEILPLKEGGTIDAKKAVAKKLVRMAIEGDVQAIKEMFNRMDGMPKQPVEHEGEVKKLIVFDLLDGTDKPETTGKPAA